MNLNLLARTLSAIGILFLATTQAALAETFPVPTAGDTIAGEPIFTSASTGDTLITIALAHTAVVRKAENPVWIPPEDIRAFNLEQGVVLPRVMPAGPDNPLGPMAIYLQIPTYLIHSTIYPDSVGRRASFGCIRMHKSDIEDFFPLVQPGTPVTIVDMPTKVSWVGDRLYLETHEPLEEHRSEPYATK